MTKLPIILCCLILVMAGAGCGGGRTKPPASRLSKAPPPPPRSPLPTTYEHPDETVLEGAVQGRFISPEEVAKLSDRMLAEGSSTFQNEQSMARLVIALTKNLNEAPQELRHRLLRNLGIIHYHQKKFNLARQELQQANELYPRDARTHFYLARLATHQGKIYQRKGLAKKAKGQFNLAANELELARKLEPSNPLYRQDLKQVLIEERSLSTDLKK